MPSWLNKRTAAAMAIMAWAGVLHFNMLQMQQEFQRRLDKADAKHISTVRVNLRTTED